MSCSWLFTSLTLNYFSINTLLYLYANAKAKGGSIPRKDESGKMTPLIEGMTDIPLREEIYSIALMCTLTDKELVKYYEDAEIPTFKIPTEEMRGEIITTAVFCFFSQLFVSILLLEFLTENTGSFLVVPPLEQLIRLICAILFHIFFSNEFVFALTNLKYIAYHPENFKYRWQAYTLCLMQGSVICVVEVVNILFLAQLSCVFEIVKNYVALAVISQFDDNFF